MFTIIYHNNLTDAECCDKVSTWETALYTMCENKRENELAYIEYKNEVLAELYTDGELAINWHLFDSVGLMD